MRILVGLLDIWIHNPIADFLNEQRTPESVLESEMSLAFLLVSLSLLQACVAPAVSDVTANDPSPFPDTNFSLASSNPTSNTCKDLDHCRTLVGIITSCLATIFACVWVAVHPNIPGPKQSWTSRQLESVKVIVVTLVVPEWVLAWAVRQFLQALNYAEMLEAARLEAADEAELALQAFKNNQNTTMSSSSDQGSEQPFGIGLDLEEHYGLLGSSTKDSTGSVDNNITRAGPDELERIKLAFRRYLGTAGADLEDIALAKAVLWKAEYDLGRTNQAWTTSHGFLAIMGGFHSYRGGHAMSPLDYEDVLELVRSRSLVPPTLDELGDRSKGDALTKTIAVFQTLWFVAQCIARRIDNLAITNLEIMTLAYTVITVAMYVAWWHKPLNVRCPTRVKGDEDFTNTAQRLDFKWYHIIDYIIGDQDGLITLSGEERVPTFWSSCTNAAGSRLPRYADIIALTVAMIFGVVHCAAWWYVFPTLKQQKMWRVCAIAITAIPMPMAAAFAVFDPFSAAYQLNIHIFNYIPVIFMTVGALLYIPARIILLVLSFTTLRQLPLSAYHTVQWTTWIPHI